MSNKDVNLKDDYVDLSDLYVHDVDFSENIMATRLYKVALKRLSFEFLLSYCHKWTDGKSTKRFDKLTQLSDKWWQNYLTIVNNPNGTWKISQFDIIKKYVVNPLKKMAVYIYSHIFLVHFTNNFIGNHYWTTMQGSCTANLKCTYSYLKQKYSIFYSGR